jgi:hypothetical protein
MPQRSRVVTLLVGLVLALSVSGCGGGPLSALVGGAPGSSEVHFTWDAEPSAASIEPAELEDLRRMAEQDGVPVEEVIATTGNQSQISAFLDTLRTRFGSEIADMELDRANGARVWFTDEVPPEALAEIRRVGKNVQVKGAGVRRFSQHDLEVAMPLAAEIITSYVPKDGAMTGGPEDEGSHLYFEVSGLEGITAEAVTDEIAAALQARGAAVPVIVKVVPGLELTTGGDS